MKRTKVIEVPVIDCDRCGKEYEAEFADTKPLKIEMDDIKINLEDVCPKCRRAIRNGLERMRLIDPEEDAGAEGDDNASGIDEKSPDAETEPDNDSPADEPGPGPAADDCATGRDEEGFFPEPEEPADAQLDAEPDPDTTSPEDLLRRLGIEQRNLNEIIERMERRNQNASLYRKKLADVDERINEMESGEPAQPCDVCENCGGDLGEDGECPNCGPVVEQQSLL